MLQFSDLHGHVAGNASDPAWGDLATMLSYEEHVVEQNDNATTGVYSSFVGDACDGTAYSDRTRPKCVEMFRLLQYFRFNSLVLGNHDIAYNDTFEYLRDNMRENSSWFRDRGGRNNFVSTNVFYKETGSNFTEMTKLETLQNGLRVLTVSFCIWDFDKYNASDVYDAETMFSNESMNGKFIADLEAKAPNTDLVVIANHIGTENAQNYEVARRVREYFKEKLNYNVPIVLLTAHTNKLAKRDCTFNVTDEDNITQKITLDNCYTSEAGYYAQQLYHVNYTLEEVPYADKNEITHTGYAIKSVQTYYSDENKLRNV